MQIFINEGFSDLKMYPQAGNSRFPISKGRGCSISNHKKSLLTSPNIEHKFRSSTKLH